MALHRSLSVVHPARSHRKGLSERAFAGQRSPAEDSPIQQDLIADPRSPLFWTVKFALGARFESCGETKMQLFDYIEVF